MTLKPFLTGFSLYCVFAFANVVRAFPGPAGPISAAYGLLQIPVATSIVAALFVKNRWYIAASVLVGALLLAGMTINRRTLVAHYNLSALYAIGATSGAIFLWF